MTTGKRHGRRFQHLCLLSLGSRLTPCAVPFIFAIRGVTWSLFPPTPLSQLCPSLALPPLPNKLWAAPSTGSTSAHSSCPGVLRQGGRRTLRGQWESQWEERKPGQATKHQGHLPKLWGPHNAPFFTLPSSDLGGCSHQKWACHFHRARSQAGKAHQALVRSKHKLGDKQ